LRSTALEYLVATLREASQACYDNTALMWAVELEPDVTSRATTLTELLLEQINQRLERVIAATWAEGSALLDDATREDQLMREEERLRYDIEDAEQFQALLARARDVEFDHDPEPDQLLLGLLESNPDADLEELASTMSDADPARAWTPLTVLARIAHLRSFGNALTTEHRALLLTPAVLLRAGEIPETRVRGALVNLRALSEQHWTLLECCDGTNPNEPQDVADRFRELTGVAISLDEVLAAATWIRTCALMPLAATAASDEADEVDDLINEISTSLPDVRLWERDVEYRAKSVCDAMWWALTDGPGPKGGEALGSVALLAGSLIGLEPDACCDFAQAVDPAFKPPTIDPLKADPTATYRKRRTDVLARQPALRAFFAHGGQGRRIRSDAVKSAQVPP
jgi:hypothetical protein